ncbi:MAG: hypothetical protein GEV00_18875 [Actinophytocola sp.]|nr:hypothetical protein [Actinophytocola sp.]
MPDADTPPESEADWRAVKVGVRLAHPPERTGDWIADASAFDAAGADALWLDPDPESKWDVVALAAALSVVTVRSLLVVAVPDSADSREGLARMLATITRLSRGRLALITEADHRQDFADIAPDTPIFQQLPGQPESFQDTTSEQERWVSTSFPQGRSAWRAARTDAAERGIRGLLVPPDPRLLDILRNPDDPDGRRDLLLAQG